MLASLPSFNMGSPVPYLTTASAMTLASSVVVPASTTLTSSGGHAGGPWPLPPKIVNRLLELEYVDMSELVPDGWRYQGDDSSSSKCCHQQKRYGRGPVTDIILWEECFSSMVEVLVTAHPEKIGQLNININIIIQKSQKSIIDPLLILSHILAPHYH
jgi:hypothetical protein